MTNVFAPASPKGDFGTLIDGTMRPEDLAPCFLAECNRLGVLISPETRTTAEALADPDAVILSETADEAMEELFKGLNDVAPFGHYFGSNIGDGSDFGFWITEEWTDALEERCIDEPDWETVLNICEDKGIEPENLCDAWEGEIVAYSEDQAEAAYAQQTAEDCGTIDDPAKWPYACIDWSEAWCELATDGYSVHALGGRRWAVVRAV